MVLDEEGSPTGIDLRVKTDATSLIEEAMILANETVAKHLRDAKSVSYTHLDVYKRQTFFTASTIALEPRSK